MRTILVTGAAARTAGWLIQRLERERNTTVVAVDELDPPVPFSSRFERLSLDRLERSEDIRRMVQEALDDLLAKRRTAF